MIKQRFLETLSNFWTNSDNKNNLHVYLAEKFVETPIFQKHLVKHIMIQC